MKEENSCCFSGHRPERLPWGYDEEDPRCRLFKERIIQSIEALYRQNVRHFISGMAQGTDLYFAEAILSLQSYYSDMSLECARPCESQADNWSQAQQLRYHSILSRCQYETMVQHTYSRGCMQRRNRYMVEHAAFLIAAYDGKAKGGTAQTVAFAEKKGLHLTILSPTER